MKTLPGLTFGFAFLFGSANVWAQLTQTKLPPPTPYAITAQDANSRVWQRTDYAMSPAGGVVTNTHSYTELCSGLNHLANGKFFESNDRIDILPNGTAVATNCQHQASFPGDIHQGQIELVTPTGQHLKSRPLMLAYFDGTNTVVIAELTNSIGVVVGNNQVVYPNSFSGLKVDLQYYYTKSGFEQNIVLKEQPPTPESLGISPDMARLQIFTEFFSPPQPTLQSTVLPAQAGLSLTDQSLNFGAMQMIQGRAFLMGPSAQNSGALVSKHWVQVNGRQFLVEEVPVDAILEGLAALPLSAMSSSSSKNAHTASRRLALPPQRLAQNNTSKTMLLAMAELPMQGFVLDYQTLNSSLTNFNFKGDTTYFISGTVNLFGTNSFEGNAVIKYTNNATINCLAGPQIFASAYLPVIFTALDDNSVGESITNSTGNPTNYYAATALALPNNSNLSLQYLRFAHAKVAIAVGGTLNLINVQMVNCQNGVVVNNSQSLSLYLKNVLMANVRTNINLVNLLGGATLSAQNVTFGNTPVTGDTNYVLVGQGAVSSWGMLTTNCIMVNMNFAGLVGGYLNGSFNGFYPSYNGFGSPSFGASTFPFQNVGAGNYYLTNGSPFRNVGTTNIDTALLGNITQKTTYPPILYSNVTVSINTTLSPQAQRDTDTPDLGYHYDPIDYLVDKFGITNALLTITNGTSVASYNDSVGIGLQDGSSIVSLGSPLYPNWMVRYSSVQEQPVSLGPLPPSSAVTINPFHATPLQPTGFYRFTKFACPAGAGTHLYDYQSSWSFTNLLVQDCEFWNGANNFSGYSNTVAVVRNNLFWRSTFQCSGSPVNSLSVSNNLFFGIPTAIKIGQPSGGVWYAFNNVFDTCLIAPQVGMVTCTNGYNAYINSTNRLNPNSVLDIVTNTVIYQTGPLGTFYQPTNSPLINKGSTNANLVGLYHYTVITNLVGGLEIKETNSTVDIGYHYVATDAYGKPMDSNGNGISDFIEDANGSGQPFTVILNAPLNGSSYAEPATIPIQATVFDWSSMVTNVSFIRDSLPIVGITNAPYTYSWPIVAAGAYTLKATAYDLAGAAATSTSIGIIVTNLCGY